MSLGFQNMILDVATRFFVFKRYQILSILYPKTLN